jgi:hypothetical protein
MIYCSHRFREATDQNESNLWEHILPLCSRTLPIPVGQKSLDREISLPEIAAAQTPKFSARSWSAGPLPSFPCCIQKDKP